MTYALWISNINNPSHRTMDLSNISDDILGTVWWPDENIFQYYEYIEVKLDNRLVNILEVIKSNYNNIKIATFPNPIKLYIEDTDERKQTFSYSVKDESIFNSIESEVIAKYLDKLALEISKNKQVKVRGEKKACSISYREKLAFEFIEHLNLGLNLPKVAANYSSTLWRIGAFISEMEEKYKGKNEYIYFRELSYYCIKLHPYNRHNSIEHRFYWYHTHSRNPKKILQSNVQSDKKDKILHHIKNQIPVQSIIRSDDIHHLLSDPRVICFLDTSDIINSSGIERYLLLSSTSSQPCMTFNCALRFLSSLGAAVARTALTKRQLDWEFDNALAVKLLPSLGFFVYLLFYYFENQKFFYEYRYRGIQAALFSHNKCTSKLILFLTNVMALAAEILVWIKTIPGLFDISSGELLRENVKNAVMIFIILLASIQFLTVEGFGLAWNFNDDFFAQDRWFFKQILNYGHGLKIKLAGTFWSILINTIILFGLGAAASITFNESFETFQSLFNLSPSVEAPFVDPSAAGISGLLCAWSILYKFCLYGAETKRWLYDFYIDLLEKNIECYGLSYNTVGKILIFGGCGLTGFL